jgi:hypothetical protein
MAPKVRQETTLGTSEMVAMTTAVLYVEKGTHSEWWCVGEKTNHSGK